MLLDELEGFCQLSPDQLLRLENHYNLLLRWNERLNLTSMSKLGDLVRLSYCESIFLGSRLPSSGTVVDIGSGGGFPGIPAAIVQPGCEFTLVESDRRKAVFLREASRGLDNVKVWAGRAELLSVKFDVMISRAFRATDLLKLNLSKSALLLVGESTARGLAGSIESLPWGKSRYLATFHVER
jgi:16S rRNA (guanine527-N7)-methyltransferase